MVNAAWQPFSRCCGPSLTRAKGLCCSGAREPQMGSGASSVAPAAQNDRDHNGIVMQNCLMQWSQRIFHPSQSVNTRSTRPAGLHGTREQPKKMPKISIRVGMNVTRPGPYLGPKICFLFGGPGTHKGRVVDDVAQMFGLQVISGEALILDNVMDRVASSASLRNMGSSSNMKGSSSVSPGTTTPYPGDSVLGSASFRVRSTIPPSLSSGSVRSGSRTSLTVPGQEENNAEEDGEKGSAPDMRGIQEILRIYASQLTLEWLLQLVSDEVDYGVAHNATGFLIDIMPNMRHLLKCESLIKDAWDEMEKFEEKYPVLFAIDLAMPQDKLPKSGDAKSKDSKKQQQKEDAEATSDEMDSYRMQRRYALYETAVVNFLQYFRETGRLVTVDASSGLPELIWQKIADFLLHMDFLPKRAVNCVVVFSFEEDAFVGMDITKYRMIRVRLASLVDNPYGPIDDLIRALCRFMDVSANVANAFAVECYGTAIDRHLIVNEAAKQVLRKRKLFFCEVEQVTLDRYITFVPNAAKRFGSKPSLAARRFQAVCLPDQAVCLFPADTDQLLCKIIAAHIGQIKTDRDPDFRRAAQKRGSREVNLAITRSSPKPQNGLHFK